MAITPWSRLTLRGRQRLKKSGVQPASYNAFHKKTKKERERLNRHDFIRGLTSQQQKRKEKYGRESMRNRVLSHLMGVLGGRANKKYVRKGVMLMDDDELESGLTTDYPMIVARAREPDIHGRDWNPWWYH